MLKKYPHLQISKMWHFGPKLWRFFEKMLWRFFGAFWQNCGAPQFQTVKHTGRRLAKINKTNKTKNFDFGRK